MCPRRKIIARSKSLTTKKQQHIEIGKKITTTAHDRTVAIISNVSGEVLSSKKLTR